MSSLFTDDLKDLLVPGKCRVIIRGKRLTPDTIPGRVIHPCRRGDHATSESLKELPCYAHRQAAGLHPQIGPKSAGADEGIPCIDGGPDPCRPWAAFSTGPFTARAVRLACRAWSSDAVPIPKTAVIVVSSRLNTVPQLRSTAFSTNAMSGSRKSTAASGSEVSMLR
jgi:hypothetical protein